MVSNGSVHSSRIFRIISWHSHLLSKVLLAYLVACLLLFSLQRMMIYHPGHETLAPHEYGLDDTRLVSINSEDGVRIEAWSHGARPGYPTIVFFHGNAGDLSSQVALLRGLSGDGYGFVAIDYRGFGNSAGTPTERGLYMDGRAAIHYAIDSLHVKPSALVLMGESLGTGVAVQMATEFKAAAVLLKSPYTSLADVAANRFPIFPVHLLMLDRFDSLSKIERINAPLFVTHGEQDSLIPVGFGRTLFSAAQDPKAAAFLGDTGHNDFNVLDLCLNIDRFLKDRNLRPSEVQGPSS